MQQARSHASNTIWLPMQLGTDNINKYILLGYGIFWVKHITLLLTTLFIRLTMKWWGAVFFSIIIIYFPITNFTFMISELFYFIIFSLYCIIFTFYLIQSIYRAASDAVSYLEKRNDNLVSAITFPPIWHGHNVKEEEREKPRQSVNSPFQHKRTPPFHHQQKPHITK